MSLKQAFQAERTVYTKAQSKGKSTVRKEKTGQSPISRNINALRNADELPGMGPTLLIVLMGKRSSILPEESPDAQAVLNGYHHHFLMGRQGQSIKS